MNKHKRPRSASEFHEERDRDLYRAFKQALCRKDLTNEHDMVRAAIETPAERFYVSEERAARVVNQWLADKCPPRMLATQRMMYEEIVRRVLRLHERHPARRINQLVWEVICQPAPRFYLTEKSAFVILRRIRKKSIQRQHLMAA